MRTQVDVTSKSVRELLERGEKHRLVDVLGNLRPGDISSIMMELHEKEQSSVFPFWCNTTEGGRLKHSRSSAWSRVWIF